MRVNTEKLICSACLAMTSAVIASSSHQPIASVVNNGGDVRIEYEQPYSGWGKFISLGCAVGSGIMLALGLKSITVDKIKSSHQINVAQATNMNAAAIPLSPRQVPQSNQAKNIGFATTQEESFNPIDAPEIFQPEILIQANVLPAIQAEEEFFHLLYTHKKKHTFFPAETGAGKTTALLGAVNYIHELDPEAIFLGSTAKPTSWGGLENIIWEEDSKPCVIDISNDDIDSIRKFYDRLVCINKLMEARQKQRQQCEKSNLPYSPPPIYIIIDEWLRTLGIAENYDKIQNKGKERGDSFSTIKDDIIRLIEDFLFAGREDNCILWLFGQDHQAQNACINTGLWKNFGFVILGVKGYLTSIREALFGRSPILSGIKLKEQIWKEVQDFEAESQGSFAYTNLVGHQVLGLPYLPDIKRKQIFTNNIVAFKTKPKEELLDDAWG